MFHRFKLFALAIAFCASLALGCTEKKPTTVKGPKGKMENPDNPNSPGKADVVPE